MPFASSRYFCNASAWSCVAVVAAIVALPQAARSLTLYETEVTCPIDGQTFKATLVGAYTSRGMRLDLKPLGDVVAPYPYPVCPGNGFVVYQSKFSADELAALRSIVASDDFRTLRREHTDHAMVAYVKQRLGAKPFDIAQSFLQASWEAERDHPELVHEYRTHALEAFDNAREHGNLGADDRMTAAVVGAELERLLGDFTSAQTRLASVQSELNADVKNPTLEKAVDQIARQIFERNDTPQALSDQAAAGTVGSGSR